MTEFARAFRLHPRTGPALDGAAFPSGRVFVLDDPEYGFATAAMSIEELLRSGYPSARIEWADEAPAPTGHGLPAQRPCTDPRHTGALREQLGCAGPDPATT